MNDDVLSRMAKRRFGEKEPTVSTVGTPRDWFHKVLDCHPDYHFDRKSDSERVAHIEKKGRMIVVHVTQEGDKASWRVHCDLCANESNYIPLKVFFMTENGIKVHCGFLEPHPGEPVAFGARHVIEKGFDLNDFIDFAVNCFSDAIEFIEQIIEGKSVEEVFEKRKMSEAKDELMRLRMRRFMISEDGNEY